MALPLAIFSSLIDYPQRGTGQEGDGAIER